MSKGFAIRQPGCFRILHFKDLSSNFGILCAPLVRHMKISLVTLRLHVRRNNTIEYPSHHFQALYEKAGSLHKMRILRILVVEGSWDLVSRVISSLIGVMSNYNYIVTLLITLVTKSHDPPSS